VQVAALVVVIPVLEIAALSFRIEAIGEVL
jgi:hypothetical protein